MKNNEFDNIIKDQLEGFSVTPSENLGKTLGKKMLFKNLWFFHKQKILVVLILIGASTFPLWDLSGESMHSTNQEIVQKEHNSSKSVTTPLNQERALQESEFPQQQQQQQLKNLVHTPQQKESTRVRHNNTPEYRSKNQVTSVKNKQNKSEVRTTAPTNNSIPKNSLKESITSPLLANQTNNEPQRFDKKQPQLLAFEAQKQLVNYTHQQTMNDDYAKSKRSQFSADAFISPYNHTNVNNILEQKYHKNWWDFYRETGFVSSGIEAGARINYDWNNIVTSTGITYNKIRDYKPKYIYESNHNEYLLDVLGISEISGVQVNGIDSAHYVFYTAQDEELIKRIEDETYSTYHYLTIPLKTGYEFKASNFSILLQVGCAYNHLFRANGTYLRRYTNNENIDIYYNKGIETALLSRKNSMLKTSYVSLLASLAGNVKIAPSIDLFGEFNFQQNRNSITKEEYFLQKDVNNFGTNFGVKYYFEPRIKSSKLEQEIF
ncbi:MAG: hypothetical protein N4A35_09205 [Flavobacteriales bacterium]|jgi:hypothetical protein|nr:hypothetical protein [Flavobacteriales bacterium]